MSAEQPALTSARFVAHSTAAKLHETMLSCTSSCFWATDSDSIIYLIRAPQSIGKMVFHMNLYAVRPCTVTSVRATTAPFPLTQRAS